jgi:hemolysin activation/secretion protein
MNTKKRAASRSALLCPVLAALFGSTAVQAQNAGSPPPNSGQLLQQLRAPAAPANANPGLTIQQPVQRAAPAGEQSAFPVRAIEITGNTLLPAEKLHALVAPSEGRSLTLGELDELANRISRAYQDAGYLFARAYVPAQTLQDGVVRIAVQEARYGKIVVQNHSQVADGPLNATLSPLGPDAPIAGFELERSLLLLSDIPGVLASSVVRPGERPGTSDLVVDVGAASRYTGSVGLDNFGSRSTGRLRMGASVDVNGLLHRGDLLGLSVLSTGPNMNFGQASYRYLLNGGGTTLRTAASILQYRLGHGMEELQAHGKAMVGSVAISQPLVRNTAGNLYGQLEFDHKILRDDIDAVGLKSDRNVNVWVATLAGDQRDATGITNFNLAGAFGKLDYVDPLAQWIDALGPDTQGRYRRYTMSVSRLQQLTPATAFYAGYSAQWSNKNLDTSEQFYLGGSSSVRGYDGGTLAGAQGHLFTVELRHDFAAPRLPGRWQAVLFADSGNMQTYKQPFSGEGNAGRLSGAGMGLHWSPSSSWTIGAGAAQPVGAKPALLGPNVETRTRYWVQVQKGFG